MSTMPEGISLVVLAKDASAAKTRLPLPRDEARLVALRLARTTVRAGLEARTVGAVLVVTSDPHIARDASRAGADVVAERRPLGMNRAADLGRRQALASRPGQPVAVVVADLPGLRPADLDAVSSEFHGAGWPLFVPDHEGTGTTLVIHGAEDEPGFGFGPHSASVHRRLGYRPSDRASSTLRWDLDTPRDLDAHVASGTWAPLGRTAARGAALRTG